MITEDYVSFEIAKLLKEKGFDAECHSHYYPCHYPDGSIKYEKDEGAQKGDKTWYNVYSLKNLPKDHYLAPTLQMAMKWLREVYKIHVAIYPYGDYSCDNYQFDVYKDNRLVVSKDDGYITYEQSCEAAIKYCLENLI